jgi:hypothetical protein
MELVAGKTMRALLHEGAFEPRRLIRFATQIAEALEAVHSHGVRHGDVKPSWTQKRYGTQHMSLAQVGTYQHLLGLEGMASEARSKMTVLLQ